MTVPYDCPRCGVVLTMSERSGVEIDYCPQCRGVWLDRGELDKIIERVEADSPQPPQQPQPAPPTAPSAWAAPPQPPAGWAPSPLPAYGDRHGKGSHAGYGGHGRRKSWLKEIFD